MSIGSLGMRMDIRRNLTLRNQIEHFDFPLRKLRLPRPFPRETGNPIRNPFPAAMHGPDRFLKFGQL
ncbi:MAG TPA: hypothetical protein PLT21_02950, partial [Syntrophales bacterium]|nr:hypothetical protein [Syntrophales bacterium]